MTIDRELTIYIFSLKQQTETGEVIYMAQDDQRQNDRNFPRLRPRDDGSNSPRKGPKFNIYWIWAIIFAVLVGFQLFGSFSPDAKHIDSEHGIQEEHA